MGGKEQQRHVGLRGKVNLFGLQGIMEASWKSDMRAGPFRVQGSQVAVWRGRDVRQREQCVLGQ